MLEQWREPVCWKKNHLIKEKRKTFDFRKENLEKNSKKKNILTEKTTTDFLLQ